MLVHVEKVAARELEPLGGSCWFCAVLALGTTYGESTYDIMLSKIILRILLCFSTQVWYVACEALELINDFQMAQGRVHAKCCSVLGRSSLVNCQFIDSTKRFLKFQPIQPRAQI